MTTSSLSFKPWARDNDDKTALSEVLARVNFERGHFRDINEASLLEEIAAEGEHSSSEGEEEEDDDQDEVESNNKKQQPAATREELWAKRHEMIRHAGDAHNDIMTALDSISLLETKYLPAQARVTMSEALKSAKPPMGSMGVDIWDPAVMKPDPARVAQDNLLATKVRMEGLQQSADGLLAAAARLQKDVRQETSYWEEILSVADKGWSISRMGSSHILGVRFGFQGSAKRFENRDVAALIGTPDGGVALERGVGTKPKAVRVLARRGGRIVGSSKLPVVLDDEETTLEARIRHARDSVYDEELFYEMIRETSDLTSMGVLVRGSTILFPGSGQDSTQLELELLPLDQDNSLPLDATSESDFLAQATLVTARLLLGQAHRDRMNEKKDVPPPLGTTEVNTKQQALSILRTLMLLSQHKAAVDQLNAYVDSMCKLLRKLGASAESQMAHMGLPVPADGIVSTEALITSLTRPLLAESHIWLIVSDEKTLDLKLGIETSKANSLGSIFSIHPPSSKRFIVPDIDTLLAAANDFLALGLSHVLKEEAGAGWELNDRDGRLTRPDAEDGRDVLLFVVGHEPPTITLHAKTTGGRKQVAWKLDSTGGAKSLKDVWQDLLE
ncbi:Mediator of RNA polymerase II transcription subunit 17 [Fulvia fulva]|uniref:Mediator of RNA polymerase II transcription subunit 17 n=1 Tax=Passalora fulva TaxID=5499 RepID=A0A9Q8PD48_PASFU|nr:Mediator of RNA polymerase II transcription subunit 17 [Fulvia fulva]KAK4619483.1 Mediator of RNA polymerase II transcription subunit 17 [Fulvia fulva]KAK4620477.1 Mediator of RNA polymerase II transcription subunit 17 [Fulvia fulva]UJO20346.1 Mediator of RNA polymerase II transcription subunit 17 [Fulvia fulva]WPV17145.1 Mediator of RNA polymerase II transcription subunit 17 [Fulvia fulva]WPV32236.1 Mediator of RNA polymerase II transcription subunit 17 [Fulvia fulva]